MNVLILRTTNEETARLHAALRRPVGAYLGGKRDWRSKPLAECSAIAGSVPPASGEFDWFVR